MPTTASKAKIRRYAAFVGEVHYPQGGGDFLSTHSSVEEAKEAALAERGKHSADFRFAEVLDLATGEIVWNDSP